MGEALVGPCRSEVASAIIALTAKSRARYPGVRPSRFRWLLNELSTTTDLDYPPAQIACYGGGGGGRGGRRGQRVELDLRAVLARERGAQRRGPPEDRRHRLVRAVLAGAGPRCVRLETNTLVCPDRRLIDGCEGRDHSRPIRILPTPALPALAPPHRRVALSRLCVHEQRQDQHVQGEPEKGRAGVYGVGAGSWQLIASPVT